jgi:hypothetical protein
MCVCVCVFFFVNSQQLIDQGKSKCSTEKSHVYSISNVDDVSTPSNDVGSDAILRRLLDSIISILSLLIILWEFQTCLQM